jgi:hypothetical protein
VGEVPAGEVRVSVLGPRRVGGRWHAIGPGAARRGSPPGQFGHPVAIPLVGAFSFLDGRGESGAAAVVGDDAQHRAIPGGALAQRSQQPPRQRHEVEPAAVRPPRPHLPEQSLFELGARRPPAPAHLGD